MARTARPTVPARAKRECGPALSRDAAAAPATVSGEFRADKPLDRRSGKAARSDRSASQETCPRTLVACAGRGVLVPFECGFGRPRMRRARCCAWPRAPLSGPEMVRRSNRPVELVTSHAAVTRILVCATCRAEGEPALPPAERAGARLLASLRAAAGGDPALEVVPVECLSVCKRPCTVGLAAPGKWTYVYGDLPVETGAAIILDAARLYAVTPDGLIPWKLRVDAIKKGVVARFPPLPDIQGQAGLQPAKAIA